MPYAPVLPVAIPLLTAALLAVLSKLIPRALAAIIAIIGASLTTLAGVLLLIQSNTDTVVYWFGGWHPRGGLALGISFAIDPIGAGLASFAGFLSLAALLFSYKYFDEAGNHFPALILAFLAAMCGFTLTGDMFNLFVFFELMSAAAFALCGYKSDDPGSLQGAINFAVTNTIGAYFVLTGVALLYARTSALNMAQMGQALASHPPDTLVMTAFTFVVCGYLIKAAVVPFHFWLADAHAVAPTPVCILFSGVMAEMGLYGVARIYWTVFDRALHPHLDQLRVLFVTIGVVTAIVGGVMCYSQRNLKRLLAYSTISHIGVITMGFGFFTVLGLAGAGIYVLGHSLVKASLFLAAGILLHRFESVDEMELYGKGRQAKVAGMVFFLGAAGLSGTPLSGIDSGDEWMHESATALGYQWTHWVSLFADVITSAAVLRTWGRVFFGWGPREEQNEGNPEEDGEKNEEKPETKEGHEHTPFTMAFPPVVLVAFGLLLELVPNLMEWAWRAAARFENAAGYAARVLNGTPIPAPSAAPHASIHILSFSTFAVAILIASAHLFSGHARRFAKLVSIPLRPVHALHSGHVGDYIAFLTFGVAVFGVVCGLFLR